MIDAYNMSTTLSESAHMHSEALKPPWWKPLERRYWKHHLQPIDIMRAYRAGLAGEAEPLQRFGVSVVPMVDGETHEEGMKRRWMSIIEQVRGLFE